MYHLQVTCDTLLSPLLRILGGQHLQLPLGLSLFIELEGREGLSFFQLLADLLKELDCGFGCVCGVLFIG
jgi:hypothetical protein